MQDLHVGFRTGAVLRGVSLRVAPGEAYGLVGESGCGKSTVAAAVLRALPHGATSTGRVLVAGQDVARLDARALRRLRARRVSLVSQDPARALNPTLTVGRQVAEAFAVLGRRDAQTAAEAMLARVRLPDPARVMAAYPHQLSGGMAQRVVLAMALAKNPALLVLDEPTTALDATVAAEVLGLLDTLRRESGTALLFISHDLRAVARMCARVGVLYAGTLVEEGTSDAVLRHPLHPYTARLLRCRPAGRRKADGPLETVAGVPPPPGRLPPGCVFAPRCDRADAVCRTVDPPVMQAAGQMALCHHPGSAADPLPGSATGAHAGGVVLQARGLSKRLGGVRVLTDVALTLEARRTLGLVGESGSGKTTLARLLSGLAAPDTGEILLDGHRLAALARARPTADRRAMQMVFQNPDSALNRAHTVRRLIARPLALLAGLRGAALETRLRALLAAVRLTEAQAPFRPRQLSGGMKQRVAIARTLAGTPRVVVCDEPTAALDVSVQAAILNLLVELQARDGVALLFISHDLDAVRYLADDLMVLYAGQVVQAGPADAVFAGPQHPYTAALLAAADGGGGLRDGAPALSGCAFRLRCPQRLGPVCDTSPPLVMEAGHAIRCHIPREMLDKRRLGGDDGAIQG